MGIDRVTLRLQSEVLTIGELTAVLGREPTAATEKGMPLSRRSEASKLHRVSNIFLAGEGTFDELGLFIDQFRPALASIRTSIAGRQFTLDLFVMLSARDSGFMVDLPSQDIDLLAQSGCGLVLDVYNDDRNN